MNKEPAALYLFKLLLFIGLFVFILMLYWSSELIEEDLNNIQQDLTEIKSSLSNIESEIQLLQNNEPSSPKVTKQASSQNIDTSLPNLLEEDLFYKTTLPKLLGSAFQPLGTRYGASIGKPDDLHPFNNWSHISAWVDLCSVSVANMLFGKYETLAPDMAIKMEERFKDGSTVPEFWIHLRDKVYWQPLPKHLLGESITLAPHFQKKHQVTAHDFKFYWDALMNPDVQQPGAASARNYLGDIEEIEVIDDLTFVVRWKAQLVKDREGKEVPRIRYTAKLLTGSLKPLPSFIYKYYPDGTKIIEDDKDPETYRTNSVWAQSFSKHWASNIIPSCGAWLYSGMTEKQINFKRNPNFYNPLAALTQAIEIYFKNSIETMWQDFKEGKTDTFALQPDQLVELKQFLASPSYQAQERENNSIKQLEYLNRSYTYIAWNQARVYFQSKKVRRALTMAIDRQRIIQQNLNGMGVEIHGTFFVNSQNNDPNIKPWPYDPIEAKKLLREEGWYDSDGDGIIDKDINGTRVPFRFSLTYYVKNPTTKAICEYVSTALKEIGIDCNLNGVDTADLSAVFDDKNFDALSLGWALGTPPEEPKQLWHSSGAKEKGSSNVIGFANETADKIIEELLFEYNPEKRRELYRHFDRIIHDEQPYTFLYTPKVLLLYREYLQNVFIPADRQDLVPGADVEEPQPNIYWLKDAKLHH